MIPLRDCDSLQLAVLSARAMGLKERPYGKTENPGDFCICASDSPYAFAPCVFLVGETNNGPWSPAEVPADALRLVAHAGCRAKRLTLELTGGGVLAVGRGDWTDRKVLGDLIQRPVDDSADQEVWLATLCRALTEASLSALGAQGWEPEPEEQKKPGMWWCCSADYPDHEPSCPKRAEEQGHG